MSRETKNNMSDIGKENEEKVGIEKFMASAKSRGEIRKKAENIEKTPQNDYVKSPGRIPKIRFSKKTAAAVFLVIIFFGAFGAAGYFYYQYKKVTSADAKTEAAAYVAKIGKFMVLPQGEVPTVATVADKDKLSSQVFFANAQNGDKVLFYAKAQKIILYRPSANMVIDSTSMAANEAVSNSQAAPASSTAVGAQNASQAASQPAAAAASNQPVVVAAVPSTAQVAVYNGTNRKGLAQSISDKISPIAGVKIATLGNAKGIYAKTEVIDLSGTNSVLAQNIATAVGGEVISLLAGESKPANADILVIGGGDFKN